MADSPTHQHPQAYDSPWKEVLEQFFPQFVDFFFPHIHGAIDWPQGYAFLDKEFQKITRTAQTGRRQVDKLVEVHLRGSHTTWVLIHIEVQGSPEVDFARRMFIYYYRIFDKYQRPLASLAVLSDDQASWRPAQFSQELLGCEVKLDFPMVKLLDYEERMAELAQNPNPFALVVLAHLQSLRTKNLSHERYAAKLGLAKLLYKRNYSKQEIVQLFQFIDWVLTLPPELDEQFEAELLKFEEDVQMQYVTTIERRAIQKGIEQGIKQGVEQGLQMGAINKGREAVLEVLATRFETVPPVIADRLATIENAEVLRQLLQKAILVSSLADFLALLPDGASPNEANSFHTTNGTS